MNKKYAAALAIVFTLGVVLLLSVANLAMVNPKGPIAFEERNLMIIATALMSFIVFHVFVLTFFFAWKYRSGNTEARYTPDWAENKLLESIWWSIPCVIILILAIITWTSTHELDPYKPLASDAQPLVIQVVALDWKWLFIYPEQGIATVNYVRFPVHTPVAFEITADAPMNSFWIPQLGGQIYAMAGMRTKLHLIADETGSYRGLSANFSGKGFSGMRFTAEASSQESFDQWVAEVEQSPQALTHNAYDEVSRPSENNPVTLYSSVEHRLFDTIVMKYMAPYVR